MGVSCRRDFEARFCLDLNTILHNSLGSGFAPLPFFVRGVLRALWSVVRSQATLPAKCADLPLSHALLGVQRGFGPCPDPFFFLSSAAQRRSQARIQSAELRLGVVIMALPQGRSVWRIGAKRGLRKLTKLENGQRRLSVAWERLIWTILTKIE